MSLETVTAGLQEKVGSDCGLGASVKFDFGHFSSFQMGMLTRKTFKIELIKKQSGFI